VDLAGRTALITGGTRLGAPIALALARRGVDIALGFNRSPESAEETARVVRQEGRRAVTVQADLSQPEACRRLVAESAAALGRLDILVCMASIYVNIEFGRLTEADWDRSLAVDLSSSFHCAFAAVPHMRRAGAGRIILFSDWVAASGRPRYRGYAPYYVAKAGVVALGEALALELASDHILVNTIAPGPMLAPEDMSASQREAVVRATPIARWGGGEVLATTVLALVESEFVTGEVVRVDGGRHVK
jgi:NAD(P)-dependent dehydrogenase (short-subunit alcohol dehydrogenase family)